MADHSPTPPEPEYAMWRRTPPALFPALFGMFGLGLAWRAAFARLPSALPVFVGETLLAVTALVYLFVLSCYISKISFRPMVLLEDMIAPPGRAGAAAMSLCLFLFSAALVPYSAIAAHLFLWVGLIAHIAMACCALLVMSQQEKGLKVTPAWHLSFVGFILLPLAAVPLGYAVLPVLIFVMSLLAALVIYAVSGLQLQNEEVPAPARPLLMIHLAPVSLFATVAALLGWTLLSYVFVAIAVGLGAVLASRVMFLTQAGFSPMWGAFTFPVAALASALFVTSATAPALLWVGFFPLIVATCIVPVIALRILLMWASGQLALKTGAGTA